MNLAISLFILLTNHFPSSTGSAPSPLYYPNDTIITVGHRHNDSLLFISRLQTGRKLHLFQYPKESLDVQNCTMKTTQGSQLPVDPVLAQIVHRQIITSALVQNKLHHDVLLAIRSNLYQKVDSVFYDLDSSPTERFFIQSTLTWEGHVLISSPDVETLFQLQTKPVPSLQKMTFRCFGDLCSDDLVNANELVPHSKSFNICADGAQQIYLSTGSCSSSVKWSEVSSGMLFMGVFFLFGPDVVYVFDGRAFEQPEVRVELVKKTLNEFFI